jgi:hypothetical protein
MLTSTLTTQIRRPRFRRAPEPPAFRLTEDDIAIVRRIAQHRFLRSTHIATLVGRSLDRTNNRLSRLFHAGYIDRPRAQLDRFPTTGSSHLIYALADRGARLLIQRGERFANLELSRKNTEAGRPFIEHQLEIVDFHVALQGAASKRIDVRLMPHHELIAALPEKTKRLPNPFALKVTISHDGSRRDVGLVSDLVFGLAFSDGSHRYGMVEIDRGTMPISRSSFVQSSLEKKMRAYLAAHAVGQHEKQFGWKTFRVLVVTTDEHRMHSMMAALRAIHVPRSIGSALFFFATRDELRVADPLTHTWRDGQGKPQSLVT